MLSITMPFDSERELSFALGVLTVLDLKQLAWSRAARVPLYESGVRYKRESEKTCWAQLPGGRGCEDWLSIVELYRQRVGDCEDLACARASQLIRGGETKARAVPVRVMSGWHILVRRADGTYEDPSVVLGMSAGPIYARQLARYQPVPFFPRRGA